MRIALVAHDKKKEDLIQFVTAYKPILEEHELFATGTTGTRIINEVGLSVFRYKSGPLGGDQQIGSAIANNEMDMVCLLYTSPSPRDRTRSRMPSSA